MIQTRPTEEEIFQIAREIRSAAARGAYLNQACGGDAQLRERVLALLQIAENEASFLELPPAACAPTLDRPPLSERPGDTIGPYKLLQEIGAGGFGVVFMAEQEQPVRRMVALKIIKAGMDTREVIARFESERQALAIMDHPNIARVLDAGATASGRPYFVMELVKGIPVTEFCDRNHFPAESRLKLFIDVCQAIQHAHHKGVIHRDVKPTNVLVTLHDGVPVVKVIDFGVAKATVQKLTERTLFTAFGQMVGTPAYMSPEQAEMSGLDIDTRSDVYSLGVLLYELLTGTTPLDVQRLRDAGYAEMQRLICEEEPPRPSTRMSSLGAKASVLAGNRGTDPRQLARLLAGDLDWIVMKALEKDRNRRYETANGFAMDVQRYLADEPVLACPPSALYRIRKFSRRHKAAVAMVGVVTAALLLVVGGLALSTMLTRQSLERERYISYVQRVGLAEREWSANNLNRALEVLRDCPEDLRGWEWHYLNRSMQGKTLPPLRHDAAVTCAALSRDGQWIASCSQDGIIMLWDAGSGRAVRRIVAYETQARSVAFSPDGRWLASASSKVGSDPEKTRGIKLWDVQTGQELPALKRYHDGGFNHVTFSPDGRRLAAAGGRDKERGGVWIWDAVTGDYLFSLRDGHGDGVFSSDGQRLAAVRGSDQEIKVWDTQSWQELVSFRGQRALLPSVALSPDGRLVAAGGGLPGQRGEAKVWDTQTGRERLTLRGHADGVSSVTFSPDGRRLATGGLDGAVKLWDVRTGEEIVTLRGHINFVRTVTFSADGHRIVTASDDGTVRVWDARPWRDGEPSQSLLTLSGNASGIRCVAFCPKGKCLAAAGADGSIKVWDLATRNERYTRRGHSNQIWDMAFSRDGQLLATAGDDRLAKVWNATTGEEVRTVGQERMRAVAFSPDGQFLATAGFSTFVRIWNVKTGEQVQELSGHTWVVTSLAYSPDGQHLASAGADSTVRLWDLNTATEIARLEPPHVAYVRDLAFSSDGQRLASSSRDRTIRLWERGAEPQNWRLAHLLSDPTGGVESVAFSGDGSLLAWASTDGTIKVWEERAGEIHTLRGHTGSVHSVAFSPDEGGNHIASGSQDDTVKIWETPRSQRQGTKGSEDSF